MYKNSVVHHITKILIDIGFFGGILVLFGLPYIVRYLRVYYGYVPTLAGPFDITLMSAGLCALYILWQFKIIFKTLVGGNPFVMANVSCLRKMAVACFIIAIVFLIRTVMYFTVPTTVIVIIFIIAGLFCLTLKDVFKQAVCYKEENDLTV
jgi:hypothetical protein